MHQTRVPSYLSCASLARELECSETTIRELVQRAILPPPVRLTSGTVRWRWADVELALGSLNGGIANEVDDPYAKGARLATAGQDSGAAS